MSSFWIYFYTNRKTTGEIGGVNWCTCETHNKELKGVFILPSWTAWKGLFPSTNSTEMVIFSVSKISLFKLRSATARRNTSSSLRADSSKMAPGRQRQEQREEAVTNGQGWITQGNGRNFRGKPTKPQHQTAVPNRAPKHKSKSWQSIPNALG